VPSLSGTLNYLALGLILGLAPACGSDSGSDDSDSDNTTADSEGDATMDGTESESGGGIQIDCATDAWDLEADTEWKGAWMEQCMVPAIAPIMQGIDAEAYADFTCTHCHGADLGGGTYAMPGGPVLDWDEAATWPTEYYDGTTLMGPMVEVALTAGELLGYEPFDPGTGEGFGCGGCHDGL
jgi:hypothetical protein